VGAGFCCSRGSKGAGFGSGIHAFGTEGGVVLQVRRFVRGQDLARRFLCSALSVALHWLGPILRAKSDPAGYRVEPVVGQRERFIADKKFFAFPAYARNFLSAMGRGGYGIRLGHSASEPWER